MDEEFQTLRNRLDFCRQLLSRGVSAPEAERLLKTIMELENALALKAAKSGTTN
ncbi:MAG TPA: hypothetical protein VEU06_11850 [Micropepsaceae bacterium]|nr:hypothetical protein [Micropepsaceae bacterium]